MKVLVVSDVHANIAALNTILEKEADYDILCCAGDYTDYTSGFTIIVNN